MRYVILLFVLLSASLALAQDGLQFNYQGRLLGSDGNPVPDGNYNMIFRIFDDSTAGNELWSEMHYGQMISRGLFDVQLGSVNPCSLGVLERGPLYLETTIGEQNPPLAGRIRLGSSPSSGFTRRIHGDIESSPGALRFFNDGSEYMGVEPSPFRFGGAVRMFEAGGDTAIEFTSEGSASFFSDGSEYMGIDPAPFGGTLNMYDSAGGASVRLAANGSAGFFDDGSEYMGIEPMPFNTGGSLKLFNAGGATAFEVTSSGSASFYSLGSEYMGIDPVPFNGGGFLRMHDLSGVTSLELNSGGAALFYRDGTERMGIEPSPFHSGVDLAMMDSDGYQTMRLGSQGSASFFSHGSEYMGIEPAPFHSGGELVMSDSDGINTMVLSSSGSASFMRNGTEYMGIDPSPFGGTLTMYGTGPVGTRVILSSEGKLSLGTSGTSNILTIQQSSPTDPIADAWTTYSSRRWKTNIQPLEGALEKVMKLNGVTYDELDGGKHNIGLIAEDVGAVVPEVVAYEENGVDAQSVDYARLTALLIEAVKEQQKMIEQLKSEINELKIR